MRAIFLLRQKEGWLVRSGMSERQRRNRSRTVLIGGLLLACSSLVVDKVTDHHVKPVENNARISPVVATIKLAPIPWT